MKAFARNYFKDFLSVYFSSYLAKLQKVYSFNRRTKQQHNLTVVYFPEVFSLLLPLFLLHYTSLSSELCCSVQMNEKEVVALQRSSISHFCLALKTLRVSLKYHSIISSCTNRNLIVWNEKRILSRKGQTHDLEGCCIAIQYVWGNLRHLCIEFHTSCKN